MKNKVKTLVLGAGAGGLGSAVWLKESKSEFMVVEGAKELPLNMHNGVHYLHSIPPLPFDSELKKITLTDGVLVNDEIMHKPSLKHALEYSEKVREIQHPSSIMEVGKEDSVFMPKSNSLNELMTQMYEYSGKENFEFGYWLKSLDTDAKIASFEKEGETFRVEYENVISTISLDKLLPMLNFPGIMELQMKLKCTPVYVTNYKVEKIVPNWMINLYIPNKNSPIYRASILNGICSVESIRTLGTSERWQVRDVLSMFHLADEEVETFCWSTGKVISISIDERTKLIETLKEMNIYLVGRFARWDRKLLVDTTINQAKEVIEEIIK